MNTVKIYYVGRLPKVRMPEDGEYLTEKEAKTKEAMKKKTVLKGQPIRVSAEAAKGLIKSGLWEQVGKNDAPKKKGGKS